MPLLSDYARKKKISYFLSNIPSNARVLEVGSGSQWVEAYMRSAGVEDYIGLDVLSPADIVGDIKDWNKLGLRAESFDFIVAFEVVEHVDCFAECYDLLKPGGQLLLTTPVPNADWFLKILERLGLNQQRTSPHCNLVNLRSLPIFEKKEIKIIGFLSQWGKFTKLPVVNSDDEATSGRVACVAAAS
jgi:SAM-dependent methyltransferase